MGLVFLFRHGETDLTEGRYCGSSDPPLNTRGRQQAMRIAELLRGQPVAAIYSSPQARARQTAAPAADALGVTVALVEALREVDFGEWEGLAFEEARARDPEAWQARRADPGGAAPPGGETYAQLAARAVPALSDLLGGHRDETIAIFAHRGVNRVFLAGLLLMPVNHCRRIGQEPGAVNLLRSRADGVEVLAVNERGHLGLSGGDVCRAASRSGARGATWKR